jgi:hypothetical protein
MYGEECCPMSSFRSEWAARPDFHPEFGYLCPSPRRRRRLRPVLVAAAAVLAVGATMALAAAHRGDADGPALTVQSDTGADAIQASTPAAEVTAAPAPPQDTCKAAASGDPAGSFLGLHCRSSKPHTVRHGARAAYRVAVVILGRRDAPPAPAEAATVVAPGNEPAEKPVAAPAPLAHATPHPKKPRADVAGFGRELGRQDATVNAYAYDPYYERYRSDSLQRGFGGWFGGR